MKLRVGKYHGDTHDAYKYLHECRDEGEVIHHVDLMVYGNLDVTPESLVGKMVEVDYLYPQIELAMNPQIIERVEE